MGRVDHSKDKECFQPISSFVTLSITNQSTEKTKENEEKIIFHQAKEKMESQAICCGEKQLSQQTGAASSIVLFREIFTFSSSS